MIIEQTNVRRILSRRIRIGCSSLDIMTSAMISGLQRSNICGEGYRIEGALLKSHPYSKHQVYLPYENCYMTFQVIDLHDDWNELGLKFF